MPVRRGKDGIPIEDPTDFTRKHEDHWERPTEDLSSISTKKESGQQTARSGARAVSATTRLVGAPASKLDPMSDPPTGWLIVVDGQGRGSVIPLGAGKNTIGCSADARARIDFGDDSISRHHATITYEPNAREFYLQDGSGRNLTYLNDQPVLVPTKLESHSNIKVGETTLRFVQLCGDKFDWGDNG